MDVTDSEATKIEVAAFEAGLDPDEWLAVAFASLDRSAAVRAAHQALPEPGGLGGPVDGE